MISTELHEGQGLGNQLWVYVACRSIAGKLGYPFRIAGRERFKGAGFLELDFGSSGGSDEQQTVAPSPRVFRERVYFDKDLDCFSSDFDERVLHLAPHTKIEGLFQSEEYFFGDMAIPGRYLKLKEEFRDNLLVGDDICVINLRGGEYKRHKQLVLPEYYWKMAMGNVRARCGIDRFVVVTDDRLYAKSLFPNLRVISGSIAECYAALHQARYLILSNTSFAYFPVKSGQSKSMVIAPMCWARFGNRFDRWASPANLYEGWLWQDPGGNLFDSKTCLEMKNRTLEYYQENFNYLVSGVALKKWNIRHLIPQKLRTKAKSALSHFFPKHFG